MDFKLELVVVRVADVERAKTCYTDRVGFNLDVDHRGADTFRVVQMTPPGSSCPITIMSLRSMHPARRTRRRRERLLPFRADRSGRRPRSGTRRPRLVLLVQRPDANGRLVQEVASRGERMPTTFAPKVGTGWYGPRVTGRFCQAAFRTSPELDPTCWAIWPGSRGQVAPPVWVAPTPNIGSASDWREQTWKRDG